MPLHRIVASAAFLAALAAVGMFLPGCRGGGTEYTMHFTHAGLLVEGADVVIGGQKAGKVKKMGLTAAGEADVTVRLNSDVPKLRSGTTASLEAPSLSGQANRFIQIDPGPPTASVLPEGAAIDSDSTESVVEIDELYSLLNKRTRDSLRDVIHGQRDAFAGRAADADRFYATFAPAVQASDRLFKELASDGHSLERFVRESGKLAQTLRSSSADLNGAVEESAQAVKGFADGSAPLEQAIQRMPGAFAEGSRAFAEIRDTVPTFEAMLARARPALEGMPRFAGALDTTLSNEDSLGQLAALLDAPGASNDLTELMGGLPSLSRSAVPSFRSGRAALRGGKPLIDQLRPYMPDLVSLWGNTGRALAPYDANGHYTRILPQFGAFEESGGTMHAVAPDARVLGIDNGNLRRCPGSNAGVECDR